MNAAQRTAVMTRSGPLLVLAGAGTGKTRVITYRIAELIRQGTPPERILAVTFTNKAAREMRERTIALLGRRKKGAKLPEVSTFHSLCVRVLRRHAPLLGYPQEFVIYDRGDQEALARKALRAIRVGADQLRPADLLALVGAWKSLSVSPERAVELASTGKEQLGAHAYASYQSALRASGAVDFDDILRLTEELFERFPTAREAEARRFDHLLIDEYQDTNALQYRIVKALAEHHGNLCVVGDDDQSIYGWRGAEVTHILNFQRDWPQAKVVRLEENYRCTAPILQLANTLIAHNTHRHGKVLRAAREGGAPPRFIRFEDEAQEAEAVVQDIAKRLAPDYEQRLSPGDFAILFRTNEQPRAFETELRRARLPYVLVGGQSFYDRKEVRDLLAYLRVLAQPADEVSLLRILNVPARGIGASSVEALLGRAVREGAPLWHVLPSALAEGEVSATVGEHVEAFRRLIEEFRGRVGGAPLATLLTELIERIDYKAELTRTYKTPAEVESRWEAVSELVSALAQYEAKTDGASLLGFLEETSLDREDRDEDKRELRAISLMTLHSAKGLEFPFVYLVGMEEGLLPHRRTVEDGGAGIEEERRLAYVGITRAREELTMTLCKGRMKWGALRSSLPSRFLMEMRGESERASKIAAAAAEAFRAPNAGRPSAANEPASLNKRAGGGRADAAAGRAAGASKVRAAREVVDQRRSAALRRKKP